MKNSLIVLSLLATILVSSCAKETEYITGANKNGLAGTSWVTTALVASSQVAGRTEEFDIWAINDACAKDNITIFKANGAVTLDEGSTKCDASDPQTEDGGTWKLSTDKKKLTFSSDDGTFTADVMQLDNSVLKFKYTETENGQTAVLTATLSKMK